MAKLIHGEMLGVMCNLDVHEIDGVLYYKVDDLLELFKQEY